MKEALKLAKIAYKNGDVPIGAVVELNGEIIGRGFNKKEISKDASMHAEILALKEASKKLNTYHLENCNLYVNLEPCPMCAGAIINFRINKVFIGSANPRYGCCGSKINLLNLGFNHTTKVSFGILEEESSKLISSFFKKMRSETL